MAEFKVINTQEEFDERIKERIERAEKKATEKAADAFKGWASPDDMKALQEKHKGEIEKLNAAHAEELKKYEGYDAKFAEYENEIKGLKTSALKAKIANEMKLPMDAVEFLQGDDEKTISESATKLSKLATPHGVGMVRNTEQAASNKKDDAFKKMLAQLGE